MITKRQFLRSAASAALVGVAASSATSLARQVAMAQAAAQGVSPAAAPAAGTATLGAIRAVTFAVGKLDAIEAAWTGHVGYQLIARTKVSRELAKSWGAPALARKRMIILGPASGEKTYLRFVEQELPPDFDPSLNYGWRSPEITVENSEQLYERLKDSPFTMRGPPGTVPTYPYLRPLQAVGPGGERVTFTWITEPRADLAAAKSFVGRTFLVAQTTPDLQGQLDFLRDTFGNTPNPVRRIPGFALGTLPLKDGAKVEVDEHQPTSAKMRERLTGGLPPGMAIVTFDCSSFDRHTSKYLAKPVKNSIEAFKGQRVATLAGHSGELIELLES